ncbi:hypothetical protein H1C71_014992, partial [Ictidomys tridecemlineatus]
GERGKGRKRERKRNQILRNKENQIFKQIFKFLGRNFKIIVKVETKQKNSVESLEDLEVRKIAFGRGNTLPLSTAQPQAGWCNWTGTASPGPTLLRQAPQPASRHQLHPCGGAGPEKGWKAQGLHGWARN